MKMMTYSEGIREGMSIRMREDPNVILFGEDVGAFGGCFGVSMGMIDEFGPERVRDTPISEPRRMEVYTAFFDSHNRTMLDTKAEIIDEHSFSDILATHTKHFFIHCRILLYSIIFPSIPMVITCQGMNFPLF